jgi:hypothetical protein
LDHRLTGGLLFGLIQIQLQNGTHESGIVEHHRSIVPGRQWLFTAKERSTR